MSSSLAKIRDEISEMLGDYHHSTVTTAITNTVNIVDIGLANVRGGRTTDRFVDQWVYVTSFANNGAIRQTTAYDATNYRLSCSGAVFATDASNLANYELHKIDPRDKVRAINQAARELYPILHKRLYDTTLITGNALPNSHFEDWAATTAPDKYAVTNCTATKTSTAGLVWGATYSAKVNATVANGYMAISSNEYPKLLDLQGETVDFKAWVYPEVANDAFLTIYTLKADGTAQTLNSTTTCPAGKWSLLELESQTINDDIQYIQFRFRVLTNAKYAYFDNARVTGKSLNDYYLPTAFNNGSLAKVRVQITGGREDICDDIGSVAWCDVTGWNVFYDGANKYLRLPSIGSGSRIELTGTGQLEDTLSADTDTMAVDEPQLSLLTSYACMCLYQNLRASPSGMGSDIYEYEMARWSGKTEALKRRLRMTQGYTTISWGL